MEFMAGIARGRQQGADFALIDRYVVLEVFLVHQRVARANSLIARQKNRQHA